MQFPKKSHQNFYQFEKRINLFKNWNLSQRFIMFYLGVPLRPPLPAEALVARKKCQ
jgi:hypothetical protein